ncbi:MAG: trypsin-like peptidase domain-containing protein [Acidobacteriota bacterium]|nr:MAG: trypsin-like peptidase domain-containing protein [Acidobacteriota bacterium]
MANSNPSPGRFPQLQVVHLSGRQRGQTQRFTGEKLQIGTATGRHVHLATGALPPTAQPAATLEREGEQFTLRGIAPQAEIWINGKRRDSGPLVSGDVLTIGREGPTLRFRVYPPGSRSYKTLPQAWTDCRDCAERAGPGRLRQWRSLLLGIISELSTQTSPLLRSALALFLALLAIGLVGLWQQNRALEKRLREERTRIEGLKKLVERSESQRLRAEDFQAAREQIDARLSDSMSRIEALEARAGHRGEVIARAVPSVVFVQGAYILEDPQTGRPLRFAEPWVGAPGGAVTLEGDGPLVELTYTGTGFVVSDRSHLLTNRHVARPWEYDELAKRAVDQGLRPAMRRLIGYLPGREQPIALEFVKASDRADLAVLRCPDPEVELVPLELIDAEQLVGEDVIVLGYPAGMRALLARVEPEFIDRLAARGDVDFWQLGQELAQAGYISPLATVGVVGQVTTRAVVYDAETTHGGSGGPVLDLRGRVIAVNTAVVPDFGGSNLGVPAGEAIELLAELE